MLVNGRAFYLDGKCSPTCCKLKASVNSEPWSFTLLYIHCELHPPVLSVEAVSDGEAELIVMDAQTVRGVDNQLIQNILVRERRALGQDTPILQGLRVELPPPQLTWEAHRKYKMGQHPLYVLKTGIG